MLLQNLTNATPHSKEHNFTAPQPSARVHNSPHPVDASVTLWTCEIVFYKPLFLLLPLTLY